MIKDIEDIENIKIIKCGNQPAIIFKNQKLDECDATTKYIEAFEGILHIQEFNAKYQQVYNLRNLLNYIKKEKQNS